METKKLNYIFSYIDEHIYEKIGLKELAEIAGYSPFYFSRKFSECVGLSVTEYIRIRKMQYALASLAEGKKVLDVSILYAFESHEGFSRSFTKIFGMTPAKAKHYLASYQVPMYHIPEKGERSMPMELKRNHLEQSMHEIVFEILKTSIEEAKEGFCTEVKIVLFGNGIIKISDNGRGIPLKKNLKKDQEVLNRIFSGGPILGIEFKQMAGELKNNMKTVSSLCESLQIRTCRDGRVFYQEYIRGIAQHEIISYPENHLPGTELIFRPDREIFGEIELSVDKIRAWIDEQKKEDFLPEISIEQSSEMDSGRFAELPV